jgi:hypothetical protein
MPNGLQYKQALPIETSDRGGEGLATFTQDQTTGVLDVPFLLQESTPTLAIDTVVDSRNITLTTGHGLTTGADAGKILELADTTDGTKFMQCQIATVTGDIILLDCPVNRIYTTTESIVAVSSKAMNVNGSATPAIFSVLPFDLQLGDMVRIIIEMRDNSAMDFETFGGLNELDNGVVIRVNNGDGTYRNLYNFKSNGDIIEQCFDHDFFLNNGGNIRGFSARLTWGGQSKHGVVIRLDGSIGTGESLEIIIQDDLTGLTRMHWTAQGSEVQS